MLKMFFLNPAGLFFLSAVAVPIIVHFLFRQRFKSMAFSSIMFLKISQEAASRKIKIQKILLLILRTLLVFLAAFSIAMPHIAKSDEPGAGSFKSADRVIIIDNSFSMSAGDGRTDNFKTARRLAKALIENMRTGDLVCVVPAIAGEESSEDKFTRNPGEAQATAEKVPFSYGDADIVSCVEKAAKYFESEKSRRAGREIYVISDFQESAFRPGGTEKRVMGELKEKGIKIIFVKLRSAEDGGIAVRRIDTDRTGLRENELVRIRAEIVNFDSKKRNCTVSVYAKDTKKKDVHVSVNPGSSSLFETEFLSEGEDESHGRVTISPSVFGSKAKFCFTVPASRKRKVLCVDGALSSLEFLSSTYYLASAFSVAPSEKEISFDVNVVSPQDLKVSDFSGYELIVFSNVGGLDEHIAVRLRDYVDNGGSIFLFTGANATAGEFNEVFGDYAGVLPAKISEENSEVRSFVSLLPDFTCPAFLKFREARNVDFTSIHFYKYSGIDGGKVNKDSKVIAKFSDGNPAVIERRIGDGKVILFAFPADVSWGDFPLNILYLPFMRETAGYVLEKGNRESKVFEDVRQKLKKPGDARVTVTTPDGKKETLFKDSFGRIIYTRAEKPGVYSVQNGDDARYFAVNARPEEFNLKSADLKNTSAENRTPEEIFSMKQQSKITPLWEKILILAMAIGVIELFVARK